MALFKEQGYEKTSMSSVAKAAGVAANTIYWYYANKDDLLIAVLNREVMQAMPHGDRDAECSLDRTGIEVD